LVGDGEIFRAMDLLSPFEAFDNSCGSLAGDTSGVIAKEV